MSIEYRLEPSALLAPSATVLVLILALATFLTLRMIDRYRSIQERLRGEDIPDRLRNSLWFKTSSYLEIAVYLGFIAYATCVAFWTINLITGIIHYYALASPTPITETGEQWAYYFAKRDLAAEFGNLVLYRVFTLFVAMLVIVFIELVPSIPWLPVTLNMFYLKTIRGSRISPNSAEKMLRQARKSFQNNDLYSAALLGGTAIEFFLRNVLDVGIPATWQEIVFKLAQRLKLEGRSEQEIQDILGTLKNTRNVRNIAAHPSPNNQVTLEGVEQLLQNADWLIKQLR